MAYTPSPVATNNIAALDDQPNDVGGLTSAQLKAKFDQFGTDFVAWFNTTHLAELATTADRIYYVNVTTGLDTNDGLTSGTALKTIQKAINILPQTINHTVTINVAAGDYSAEGSLSLAGFFGRGIINIYGDSVASTSRTIKNIICSQCDVPVNIRGLNANATDTQPFKSVACKFVYFSYCNTTTVAAQIGFLVMQGGLAWIVLCVASNKSSGIRADSAEIYSSTNSGTGNTTGLEAIEGGTIAKTGTQPGGTTAESAGTGGLIRS